MAAEIPALLAFVVEGGEAHRADPSAAALLPLGFPPCSEHADAAFLYRDNGDECMRAYMYTGPTCPALHTQGTMCFDDKT